MLMNRVAGAVLQAVELNSSPQTHGYYQPDCEGSYCPSGLEATAPQRSEGVMVASIRCSIVLVCPAVLVRRTSAAAAVQLGNRMSEKGIVLDAPIPLEVDSPHSSLLLAFSIGA